MMRLNKLKIWLCLACLAYSMAAPLQQGLPLEMDIIDLAAISRMNPQQLEVLAEGLAMQEMMRTKRSSAQALTAAVVSKASSGLSGKIGLLGQASAGAVSLISAASSKSGGEETGYSYEAQDPKVDFWGLKKSILYTLFQAVKAITGGVTILKGQLIKGGGALAASLGKVISVKGDAVSNLGKKIVTSAALSPPKKPESAPIYGPPPPIHYPPSAYGVPTAPAHFSGPSAPSGYGGHKYPAHLEGRGKLNGVHAGFIVLTPVGGDHVNEMPHSASESSHTTLDPPPSLLHSAFNAIKSVFSSAAPTSTYTMPEEQEIIDQPPPPPPPVPSFKPMSWGAVNSYGEPAVVDAYPDYDPRHPHPTFDVHATSKHSEPPAQYLLTQDKIQKISSNINKVLQMHQNLQRSSEELPRFSGLDVYQQMLLKAGKIPLATPVVTDAELGVLSADLQPSPVPTSALSTSTTSTLPPTTSNPTSTAGSGRKKKETKFILRGNRIVQV